MQNNSPFWFAVFGSNESAAVINSANLQTIDYSLHLTMSWQKQYHHQSNACSNISFLTLWKVSKMDTAHFGIQVLIGIIHFITHNSCQNKVAFNNKITQSCISNKTIMKMHVSIPIYYFAWTRGTFKNQFLFKPHLKFLWAFWHECGYRITLWGTDRLCPPEVTFAPTSFFPHCENN